MLLLSRVPAAVPLAGVLALLLLLSGCNPWPADPRDSLAAAQERGALRVGVIANPPWVDLTDPSAPSGVESELVTEFAEQLGLQVQWHHGGVEQQVEALGAFELDLLLGGFSAANPWNGEVGQTFIYLREDQHGSLGKHVMLTAPGENALLMALERFLLSRQSSPSMRGADPS